MALLNQVHFSEHIAITAAKNILESKGFELEQDGNGFQIQDQKKEMTNEIFNEVTTLFKKHHFRTSFFHQDGISVISFYKYQLDTKEETASNYIRYNPKKIISTPEEHIQTFIAGYDAALNDYNLL